MLSYASGKDKSSFMKLINNGMYALMLSEGKDAVVDGVESDNDNEILGATSVDGTPLSRGDVVAVLLGTEVIEEDTNCAGVDEKLGDYFPDNLNVDLSETSNRDPFGGVVAPEGFAYIGKLAFLCFGPTLKYFTGTLAMGGMSECSAEEKRCGSRIFQPKVNAEQDNLDRELGGNERGLTMQSKMQCAFMAQNKDDTDQCHQDMQMV